MNKCVNIKNKNKTFVHPSEEKTKTHQGHSLDL